MNAFPFSLSFSGADRPKVSTNLRPQKKKKSKGKGKGDREADRKAINDRSLRDSPNGDLAVSPFLRYRATLPVHWPIDSCPCFFSLLGQCWKCKRVAPAANKFLLNLSLTRP